MKFTGSFGGWLRQHRKALDLTQRDLADQVGCAEVTIRRIEGDAARPSKQITERMADVLAIALEDRSAFVSFARRKDGPFPASPVELTSVMPDHNLPLQLTPFIGRSGELAEIATRLIDPDCRLLTLVGPGGIGKTRLALELARGANFAGGVYFVSLAPLSHPELLVSAIAEAVKFPFYPGGDPRQQLLDYFREKAILLVLDNFDHLLTSATLVSELLQVAPALKVIATSRTRLNLQEEFVLRIEGLDYAAWSNNEEALEYSAAQLFFQSARRAQPDFALRPDDFTYLARICRQVEGMPLAILLAAAWVDMLSLAEIAQEIAKNVDFLETEQQNVPARQRSIRAVFDYSWNLLSAEERSVFARLSVFRGDFMREAAQEVAGAKLRTLARLAHKSMLRRDPNERYEVHELLRQYAERELAESGDLETALEAHSNYFSRFMEQRLPDVKGHRQREALNEIEADFNNVRAAWAYALTQKNIAVVDRMLECLSLYCEMRAGPHEGATLFRAGMDAFAAQASQMARRIWGRLSARYAQMLIEDAIFLDNNSELLVASLAIARANQEYVELAFCLMLTGIDHSRPDEDPSSIPFFEESLQYYRTVNDPFYIAELLGLLNIHHEAIDLHRRTGNMYGLARALERLAWSNLFDNQFAEADRLAQEALPLRYKLGHRYGIAKLTALRVVNASSSGSFQAARLLNKDLWQESTALNDLWCKSLCLAHESLLMIILDEDYAGAKQLSDEGIRIEKEAKISHAFWWYMVAALAAYCLGDFPTAYSRYREAFQQKMGPVTEYYLTTCLSGMLMAHDGKKEHAVEIFSLAKSLPFVAEAWHSNWTLPNRVLAQLQAELPPDVYAAAWERGKELRVEVVARELLDQSASVGIGRN